MKRGGKMLLLLVSLAVLAVGYYGVTRLGGAPEVAETVGAYPLADRAADEVTALSWTADGEAITLIQADGAWTLAADPAFPLDQAKAAALAEAFCGLRATRELTGVTDLADYGLAEPICAVAAAFADGTERTLYMGAETALTSEYYVRRDDGDAVYTLGESLAEQFDDTLTDLAVLEALPAIGEATRVALTGQFDQTYDDAAARWTRTEGGEPGDTASVTSLVSAAKGIAWTALMDYHADDETLEACGLAEGRALTVESTVETEDGQTASVIYTLLLGNADSETGDTYARLPGSRMVYQVAAEDLVSLNAATDDSLRDKTVLALLWDDLEALRFTMGGETRTALIARETLPAEDAGGEETAAVTATLDGVSVEASAVQAALSTLTGAKASAVTEDAGDGAAIILEVVAVASDGTETSLVFREHDADSYRLDGATARDLLVPADKIDRLIRQLKAL